MVILLKYTMSGMSGIHDYNPDDDYESKIRLLYTGMHNRRNFYVPWRKGNSASCRIVVKNGDEVVVRMDIKFLNLNENISYIWEDSWAARYIADRVDDILHRYQYGEETPNRLLLRFRSAAELLEDRDISWHPK